MAYSDLKAFIVSLVEAAFDSAPNNRKGLRAALGDTGDGPTFNTVIMATVNEEDITTMAGSAWGPAADRQVPEDGPDLAQLNQTVIAYLVRGMAMLGRRQIMVEIVEAPITTGLKVVLPPQLAQSRILGWSVIGDASGSIEIDIRVDPNSIPGSGDSITGSGTRPNLTADRFKSSSNLEDWDTLLDAGDLVGIHVLSVSGLDSVMLVLDVEVAFVP